MVTSGRVPARFETAVRVRFDEAGADGQLRTSGHLRYVQDVAWQHSEEAGFGREWYGQRSLTWLVRATELDVLRDVGYGASLVVSTEVIGFRRVWARRLSEVRRPGGAQLMARVTNDWVLLGASGTPTRVPPEIVEAFPVTMPSFAPLRLTLPPAPPDAAVHEFVVSRRDTDPMAHMNNAAYVDYLEDALEAAGATDGVRALPRRYALEYALPAPPGVHVVGTAWPTENGWAYRLRSTDGSELFRATVTRGANSASSVGSLDRQSVRAR